MPLQPMHLSITVMAIFERFLVRLLINATFIHNIGISMPVFIILQGVFSLTNWLLFLQGYGWREVLKQGEKE